MVNNLVIGRWYNSSKWNNWHESYRFMAKYNGLDGSGYFTYIESVNKSGYHTKIGTTNADQQNWKSFSEVPKEELEKYLPSNHPDLSQKIYELWH
jgi:hypothetical protein